MWRKSLIVLLAYVLMPITIGTIRAQPDLPRCAQRPTIVELPRVEGLFWCIELAVQADSGGELAFTAIATSDDGTLYAARPFAGAVFAITDSNGDQLPDAAQLLLDGLQRPNGLAYAEGALYIVGDGHIYRWQANTLETLVDDLPAGRGFLASGIQISQDRIYVAIPAPCDFCVPEDPLRGTVISMALDGSDRQVVARGLRYPAGLLLQEDEILWVTDTARDGLRAVDGLDELNRIDLTAGTVPHFGWPFCVGLQNIPDLPGDFDCAQAMPPAIALQTHSTPLHIMHYGSTTFPHITDEMILVLGGTSNNAQIRGYQIVSLELQSPDHRITFETILPYDRVVAGPDRLRYDTQNGYFSSLSQLLNRRGAGTWPHHPYAAAISPQGWLYLSVGGGTIYALRPGDFNPCDFTAC